MRGSKHPEKIRDQWSSDEWLVSTHYTYWGVRHKCKDFPNGWTGLSSTWPWCFEVPRCGCCNKDIPEDVILIYRTLTMGVAEKSGDRKAFHSPRKETWRDGKARKDPV